VQSKGQRASISSMAAEIIWVGREDIGYVLSCLLDVAGFIVDPELETVQSMDEDPAPCLIRRHSG